MGGARLIHKLYCLLYWAVEQTGASFAESSGLSNNISLVAAGPALPPLINDDIIKCSVKCVLYHVLVITNWISTVDMPYTSMPFN